jgi:hypothetical protein
LFAASWAATIGLLEANDVMQDDARYQPLSIAASLASRHTQESTLRCLVTGFAGFLGSTLTEGLVLDEDGAAPLNKCAELAVLPGCALWGGGN